LEKSENIEKVVREWLKLDTTKLFEKAVSRPRKSKRVHFEKPWKHKDSKLIIG